MGFSETFRFVVVVMAEIVVLTLLDFYAWVPFIGAVIFRKISYFHRHVTSDIPGSPHAFDSAIISLFRTLPEPSNLNIVWTSLPLEEPLMIRGRKAKNSRINSLSLYPARKYEAPSSMDLLGTEGENGVFEVVLCPVNQEQSVKASHKHVLTSYDWERGMLSMRNYLVPPGTMLYTPEIIRVKDGSVVREAQRIVAGAPQVALMPSKFRNGAFRTLITNAIVLVINMTLLHELFCWKVNALIMATALLSTFGLYQLCYVVGRRTLGKFYSEICRGETNKLVLASLEQGSKTSQPSLLHKYWAMMYDIPSASAPAGEEQGEYELQITGRINRRYQQYWSIVMYDPYGLCLPQYVYDDNVVERPVYDRNEDKDAFQYDVRLRVHTTKGGSAGDNESRPDGVTDVDVSGTPRGFVMFRLVHPVTGPGVDMAHIEEYCQPTVKLVAVQRPSKKQD